MDAEAADAANSFGSCIVSNQHIEASKDCQSSSLLAVLSHFFGIVCNQRPFGNHISVHFITVQYPFVLIVRCDCPQSLLTNIML